MEILAKNNMETIHIGERIGKLLQKGDCVLLKGDLGAGKTTMTKGIAKGLGIEKIITSPTFTILKIYEGDIPLYHMDFYRLSEKSEDFDLNDYIESDGVCVIEWPLNCQKLLPEEYLEITIEYEEAHRRFFINGKGIRYRDMVKKI